MLSRSQAALVTTELELLLTTLVELWLDLDDELEDDDAIDDLLELLTVVELDEDRELIEELELDAVPQPMGWVETTISSIHTSAELLLKLWKPNIT